LLQIFHRAFSAQALFASECGNSNKHPSYRCGLEAFLALFHGKAKDLLITFTQHDRPLRFQDPAVFGPRFLLGPVRVVEDVCPGRDRKRDDKAAITASTNLDLRLFHPTRGHENFDGKKIARETC
jgi:hypothetical protein